MFEQLQRGDFAVFLSGRRLAESSFAAIVNSVAGAVGFQWKLSDLDDFIKKENVARRKAGRPPTQATIFIDAVNEYTSGGGAQQLLRELIDCVASSGKNLFEHGLENIRVIATCRTETWRGYRVRNAFDRDAFFAAVMASR